MIQARLLLPDLALLGKVITVEMLMRAVVTPVWAAEAAVQAPLEVTQRLTNPEMVV